MTVELRFMPCVDFELSIHEFVDGEISELDASGLVVHLELCDDCRSAVELLRKQVRVHQESVEFGQMADAFDKNAFLRRLHGTLVDTNIERLAGLFYELGKAYFVSGNDSKMRLYLHKKAVSIERTRAEGRRIVKETAAIAVKAADVRAERKAKSLKRADDLLSGKNKLRSRPSARSGRTTMDNARRFLEECLILQPSHSAARIYLGMYLARVDRLDEAAAEYQKLLSDRDVSKEHRVHALLNLSNVYGMRREYDRAVECFEELLQSDSLGSSSKFFHVTVSHAMFLAKLGHTDRCTEAFDRLVANYPDRVPEARAILDRARVFRQLLDERKPFRIELERRYPTLFAG